MPNLNEIKPKNNAQPIRNNRIKRDFKRLLAIITDDREPDYSEVEALAAKYGLYFDEEGNVREERR